jgi:hypothetical protein
LSEGKLAYAKRFILKAIFGLKIAVSILLILPRQFCA